MAASSLTTLHPTRSRWCTPATARRAFTQTRPMYLGSPSRPVHQSTGHQEVCPPASNVLYRTGQTEQHLIDRHRHRRSPGGRNQRNRTPNRNRPHRADSRLPGAQVGTRNIDRGPDDPVYRLLFETNESRLNTYTSRQRMSSRMESGDLVGKIVIQP